MNTKYNKTNLGNISINNEVIKKIALEAAVEIDGIHGVQKGIIRQLWSLLSKNDPALGVTLEFVSTNEIKLNLNVMIDYGINIPLVAGLVQENVKSAVENMAGLVVTEVGIKIAEMMERRNRLEKQNQK